MVERLLVRNATCGGLMTFSRLHFNTSVVGAKVAAPKTQQLIMKKQSGPLQKTETVFK